MVSFGFRERLQLPIVTPKGAVVNRSDEVGALKGGSSICQSVHEDNKKSEIE